MFEESFLSLSQEIARSAVCEARHNCRISVIIPCHNSAAFIRPCLEALSRQTLSLDAFEIICVDDCSTDDTLKVLTEWEGRLRNLRVIRHTKNLKQGAARNSGLNSAKSEFVLFVDSDDFLRPDALEVLLSAAECGTDVVVGQLVRVRYDKPYPLNPAFRRMPESKEVAALTNSLGWFPVCMLIRSEVLDRHSIRFRENVYFEDIDFCVRLFLACQTCHVINEKLYYYVQRDGSTVNSMDEKKVVDSASAMAGIFGLISGRNDLVELFAKTANSWLRLQASRIRDGGLGIEERKRLGSLLLEEVRRLEIDKYLGDAAARDLSAIAGGAPKHPSSPSGKSSNNLSSSPWGGCLRLSSEIK